jgi:2-polyprenyl-6-methoxyphenol hydroxylase-like FAD-dependent oxidoreductase
MTQSLSTRCCVVGGGPAGMMLGFLLARAGVDVTVLEKHADFLRDFRGDTVHPSTLELMRELGLLDDFLRLPHQKVPTFTARFGEIEIPLADFSRLPTHCQFIALMPQWDFLNFLAERARAYPSFALRMRAEATGLIEEGARTVGVRAATPDGQVEIRADLVVGADGRHSTIRRSAGLAVRDLGAPLDVLWFRLPRRQDDPTETAIRFAPGVVLVLLNRGAYWQCGYVIPKGGIDEVRRRGLSEFARRVTALATFLGDRTEELHNWDDIKLLTVTVDRLTQWYREGILCIGDAAHAMSPIGGVGINLAIQDAVAAANLLTAPLRRGGVSVDALRAVQRRREFPTAVVQRVQLFIQDHVVSAALRGSGQIRPPRLMSVASRVPLIRDLPARLFGLGVRPEHIDRTAAGANQESRPQSA